MEKLYERPNSVIRAFQEFMMTHQQRASNNKSSQPPSVNSSAAVSSGVTDVRGRTRPSKFDVSYTDNGNNFSGSYYGTSSFTKPGSNSFPQSSSRSGGFSNGQYYPPPPSIPFGGSAEFLRNTIANRQFPPSAPPPPLQPQPPLSDNIKRGGW